MRLPIIHDRIRPDSLDVPDVVSLYVERDGNLIPATIVGNTPSTRSQSIPTWERLVIVPDGPDPIASWEWAWVVRKWLAAKEQNYLNVGFGPAPEAPEREERRVGLHEMDGVIAEWEGEAA